MLEPININKANLTQLKTLKEIGDAKAQAITKKAGTDIQNDKQVISNTDIKILQETNR